MKQRIPSTADAKSHSSPYIKLTIKFPSRKHYLWIYFVTLVICQSLTKWDTRCMRHSSHLPPRQDTYAKLNNRRSLLLYKQRKWQEFAFPGSVLDMVDAQACQSIPHRRGWDEEKALGGRWLQTWSRFRVTFICSHVYRSSKRRVDVNQKLCSALILARVTTKLVETGLLSH